MNSEASETQPAINNVDNLNKERSITIVAEKPVLVLSNGNTLEFKAELDTKTYMKMKQDTQRMVIDSKKSEGVVPLTKEYEYFADLCLKITDNEGRPIPVNQAYLETIGVPDFMKIESVIRGLLTFDLGK